MKKHNRFFLLILILFLINVRVCQAARVTGDQIVLYTFKEGSGTTVNDVSGVGAALNLTIASEPAISWIPGGGLSVDAPTIIGSGVASTKVIDALKISNEITVEAWVKPANTTQGGPARIVTISFDSLLRNFTLGQATNTYDIRLRTTGTSLNGIPSVSTPAGTSTANLTHVVYTRDAAGAVKIYIDGNEEANGTIGGDCSNWDDSYNLALANELTNDRAWLGEIYLVAIHDRALTEPEVDQNFAEGAIVECNVDGDCDDANVCTDDACVGNVCQYSNNIAPCDDSVFCNGSDTCGGGTCSVHAGDPCSGTECNTCQEATDSCFDPGGTICTDDGNVCTDDQCDGAGACVHPNNTASCDDLIACTESDTCSGGACNGTPNNTLCSDANSCTDDICTAGVGCSNPNNSDPCDDLIACTESDTCSGGACNGTPNNILCSDANSCTDDVCTAGVGCSNPNNTASCDDLIACTESDTCSGGACNGTPNNTLCSDANSCTDDICTAGVGCSNPNNTASCDDLIACTESDTCSGGACNGTPNNTLCSDANSCTDDVCTAGVGCSNPNNTDPCDDSIYCNGSDTCGGGTCSVHAGDPCSGTECNTCQEATDSCFDTASTSCTDDGNVCTDDQCDGAGACVHPNNTASCDDLIACTESDTCSGGACNGTPNNTLCSDANSCTDDVCTVGVGCSNPNNTASCDDLIACTESDTCSGGACNGTPNNTLCSDANSCTDDICTVGVGCSNPNNTASCDDLIACTESDTCSGGACNGTPNNTLCSDANSCTDDICTVGVGCSNPNNTASCDDLIACTESDTCSGGACNGTPNNTLCSDANSCTDDICTVGVGCSNPNNTASCDDLIACTESDTCSGGACNGTANNTLCSDGNSCTDGVCTVGVGCSNPNNTDPCDDSIYCNGSDTCGGGTCSVHAGDPCSGTECNTCQEATDSCFDTAGTTCTDDGNVCTDDQCDGAGVCAHPNNTASCDDGLYCTQIDDCQGGLCIGRDDPCIDDTTYCDGVEYCLEDVGDFICNSTGDPCDVTLTCDEAYDVCDVSDVTVIVADAYGYSGTIDIELNNFLDSVSEVRLDICDRDQRPWLTISPASCSTTARSSAFTCALTNLGGGCVGVDVTSGVAGLILPGTGAIAQLSYTIDPSTPPGDYADVIPENSDIRDSISLSLEVTPKPGKVGTVECIDAADCDDLNVCTDDACTGNVCQYINNANPCDDGLYCNGTDACRAGTCSEHTGSPCPETECNTCQEATDSCFDPGGTICTDDGNVCTDDTCDGAGACVHPNNTAPCDDLIACTESDTCSGGACNGTPNNTLCSDANSCTDDVCTAGVGCSNPDNSDPCDDGVFCNGSDTCGGGTCSVHAGDPCSGTECNTCQEATDSCFDTAGTSCTDDGNVCTDDQCDGAGACVHPNNTAPCDDLIACTESDTCSGGACNGTPNNTLCSDANSCTDDVCMAGVGCSNPNNSDPCDDSIYCNGSDTCGGGTCSVHAGDPCTDDSLYCTGTEYCDEPLDTCANTGDPCTPLVCDDGTDTCTGSTASLILLDAYGTPGTIRVALDNLEDEVSEVRFDLCDPEQHPWLTIPTGACTLTGRVPQGAGASCQITDPVPADGCLSLEILAETGNVISLGTGPIAEVGYTLTPVPPVEEFADLVPENIDVLDDLAASVDVTPQAGKVGASCQIDGDCEDNNPCTTDTCNGGVCEYATVTGACDDGLYCTDVDTCVSGVCTGTARDCDDGLYCTGTESCDEGGDQCLSSGDPCPGSECNTCQEATDSCFDTAGTTCIDDGNICTDDTCDGAGVCGHPNNTAPCDDLIACTESDTCSGGACNGTPNNTLCPDGNICTDDICTAGVGCSNPNNTDPCDDGVFCNGSDTCGGGSCSVHPGDPCSGTECNTCQEVTDSCFDPIGSVCTDDGNICTDDQCDGAGACAHPNNSDPCDDLLFCNGSDTCGGRSCSVHAGNPCPETECNTCQEATDSCFDSAGMSCTDDGNVCTNDECDGAGSCVHPNNTDPCDDLIACTESDTCSGGVCNGTPNNTLCSDANSCTDDVCTAGAGCSNPNNSNFCDDTLFCNGNDTCSGGSCSVHVGNPCPETECNTCQEATDSCFNSAGMSCTDDGNLCTDDECDGAGSCVHFNNSDPCDDGLFCTQTDECQSGQCAGSNDPCLDDEDFCNGVEYCQEDAGGFLCHATGDPCDLLLTCDEVSDVCELSDVSLIITNAFGYSGTIDIVMENSFDAVGEVHVDVCDIDKRVWLYIDTGSCGTTVRSSGFSCAISDLGGGCVRVDLTTVSGVIDPGSGVIAQLTYTIDAAAPLGDFADLTPENIDIRDDTAGSLSVTPKPGMGGVAQCRVDGDCDDSNVCTDDACVDTLCQYTNNTDVCDDGLFCNGEEFCVEGICEQGSDPCTQDEICDEEDDLCILPPPLLLEPESWFQSRWIPIIMPLKIKGSNTHFASFLETEVTFNPVNSVWALPPYVKDDETISMIIFIMPLWFTGPLEGPVKVTVTTGSEVVSGFFDVRLLPFLLDEGSEKLQ